MRLFSISDVLDLCDGKTRGCDLFSLAVYSPPDTERIILETFLTLYGAVLQ